MKNIFKETDILLKNYGGIQLTGEDLVVYEHNKKSIWAAFVYYATGYAFHRFYIWSKCSIVYIIYFFLMNLLAVFLTLHPELKYNNEFLYNIFVIMFFVAGAFYIIELFMIVPLVNYNNLLLKKSILDRSSKLKDRGRYRIQEFSSVIILVLIIFIRWLVRN